MQTVQVHLGMKGDRPKDELTIVILRPHAQQAHPVRDREGPDCPLKTCDDPAVLPILFRGGELLNVSTITQDSGREKPATSRSNLTFLTFG